MKSAAGNDDWVDFINLRGQFIEKRGKGLSFAEGLKTDKNSHVFSIVLLDEDSRDNVKAMQKAAREGNFFGRFFIAAPDFEFANFSIDELVNVLLALAARDGYDVPPHNDILSLVVAAESAKDFFDALRNTMLVGVDKGADWGAALMNHAVQHPKLPQGHRRAGGTQPVRPVIEAAQFVIDARRAGYVRCIERLEVDPETGELREKQEAEARPSHQESGRAS